jgi:imidazolonepropionase-like amidohydrolase
MKIFLFITSIFFSNFLFAQKTILHCGKLIDVKELKVLTEMSVIVEDNKIIDVQKGYINPSSNDKIIELKDKTVMPGLIDCHVHMEEQTSPTAFTDQFRMNSADYAFQSVGYAYTTLMAGFTTVRDVGGSGVNISLRNAINKGLIKGPRIYTAGKIISSTGGHGDQTNGLREDMMDNPALNNNIANGVDECIKAVRLRYKEGSHLIKITA